MKNSRESKIETKENQDKRIQKKPKAKALGFSYSKKKDLKIKENQLRTCLRF